MPSMAVLQAFVAHIIQAEEREHVLRESPSWAIDALRHLMTDEQHDVLLIGYTYRNAELSRRYLDHLASKIGVTAAWKRIDIVSEQHKSALTLKRARVRHAAGTVIEVRV